jgi:hypothetical protein
MNVIRSLETGEIHQQVETFKPERIRQQNYGIDSYSSGSLFGPDDRNRKSQRLEAEVG